MHRGRFYSSNNNKDLLPSIDLDLQSSFAPALDTNLRPTSELHLPFQNVAVYDVYRCSFSGQALFEF